MSVGGLLPLLVVGSLLIAGVAAGKRERPRETVPGGRLFTSFVRHQDNPPADDPLAVDGRPRADVQAVMDFIGSRGDQQISCERASWFVLDLRRANLRCADLQGASLKSANLDRG